MGGGPGRRSTHLRGIHPCCRPCHARGPGRLSRAREAGDQVGPKGSAWAGWRVAARTALSDAVRGSQGPGRRLPGPGRRRAGTSEEERRLRRPSHKPATVSGRGDGRRASRLAQGAEAVPATSLPRPARSGVLRRALPSTRSWRHQPPLSQGCAPAARQEVPPLAQEASPGGLRWGARGGSSEPRLLGTVD